MGDHEIKMIYQCYKCKKLFDEDEGVMVVSGELNVFPVPFHQTLIVFKCKNCIALKAKKRIEEIQNERKIKAK